MPLEGDPFVELGQGELDLDLRQDENGVGDQDFMRPCIAGALVDGGADTILLEDDISPNGRRGLIFKGFGVAINSGRLRADDFEDDDGFGEDSTIVLPRCAGDERVGIANMVPGYLYFEVAPVKVTGTRAKASADGDGKVRLDVGVRDRAAESFDWANAVELEA